MRPTSFPQMTGTLNRPLSMKDGMLLHAVHYAPFEDLIISCWRPTWRERVQIFFGMPIWLHVFSRSHPPVALEVQSPFDE